MEATASVVATGSVEGAGALEEDSVEAASKMVTLLDHHLSNLVDKIILNVLNERILPLASPFNIHYHEFSISK